MGEKQKCLFWLTSAGAWHQQDARPRLKTETFSLHSSHHHWRSKTSRSIRAGGVYFCGRQPCPDVARLRVFQRVFVWACGTGRKLRNYFHYGQRQSPSEKRNQEKEKSAAQSGSRHSRGSLNVRRSLRPAASPRQQTFRRVIFGAVHQFGNAAARHVFGGIRTQPRHLTRAGRTLAVQVKKPSGRRVG